MKYEIRRLIASIVLAPLIATIYVLAYAVLVGLGATPTTDISGAWSNGWLIAFAISVVFIFWTRISALVSRGE